VEHELDVLRQRLKAERQRSADQQAQVINAMKVAMDEARMKLAESQAAARRQTAFLRRCRNEADAARASFEQDIRRRQAFFAESEAHRARREADKASHAEEQRWRSAAAGAYAEGRHGESASSSTGGLGQRPPPLVRTKAQAREYDAFEDAFESFEAAAPATGVLEGHGLTTVPWPPLSCPVSGMRPHDTPEQRKHRLKLALLRWHPDKFVAAHGDKLRESERPAVLEKVNATLQRIQAERILCAELDAASLAAASTTASAGECPEGPATTVRTAPRPARAPSAGHFRAPPGGAPPSVPRPGSGRPASGYGRRTVFQSGTPAATRVSSNAPVTRPSKRGHLGGGTTAGVQATTRRDHSTYESRYE